MVSLQRNDNNFTSRFLKCEAYVIIHNKKCLLIQQIFITIFIPNESY